jgi:hypothetical protein
VEGLAYERGSGCAELLRVLGVVESVIKGENLDSKNKSGRHGKKVGHANAYNDDEADSEEDEDEYVAG